MNLVDTIGLPAMLEQTAEECTELAQACLKMARQIRKENPTHKTDDEIRDNFYEEMADVIICMNELKSSEDYDNECQLKALDRKNKRLRERLKGREEI